MLDGVRRQRESEGRHSPPHRRAVLVDNGAAGLYHADLSRGGGAYRVKESRAADRSTLFFVLFGGFGGNCPLISCSHWGIGKGGVSVFINAANNF